MKDVAAFLLAAACLLSGSPAEAVSWVQTQIDGHNTATSILTTTSFSFQHTFSNGNALGGMVIYTTGGGGAVLSSIADNLSNNYPILATATISAGAAFAAIYGAAKIPGTPTTLTLTFTGAVSANWNVWAFGDEVVSAAAVDKNALLQNSPAVSVLTSGSVTTTSADLILGYTSPNSDVPTAGTGFTLRLNDTTLGLYSESMQQVAAGSVAATFNVSPNDTGPVGLIAFSPACAGSLGTLFVGC